AGLGEADGLERRVDLRTVDLLGRRPVVLAARGHTASPISAGVVCGSARTLPRGARGAGNSGRGASGVSVRDGDAHGTGGAGDDLRRGVDVVRVEVDHLALGDLTDLRLGERADLRGVRRARALGDAGGLLDELGGGRGL